MAPCEGCPAPSRPTVSKHWSVCRAEEGRTSPSLALEIHQPKNHSFVAAPGLHRSPLSRFQRLGTISFLTPKRCGGTSSGICRVNALCTLQGMRCILSTIESSFTQGWRGTWAPRGENELVWKESPLANRTDSPPSTLISKAG